VPEGTPATKVRRYMGEGSLFTKNALSDRIH